MIKFMSSVMLILIAGCCVAGVIGRDLDDTKGVGGIPNEGFYPSVCYELLVSLFDVKGYSPLSFITHGESKYRGEYDCAKDSHLHKRYSFHGLTLLVELKCKDCCQPHAFSGAASTSEYAKNLSLMIRKKSGWDGLDNRHLIFLF